jgi:hypothetical protein
MVLRTTAILNLPYSFTITFSNPLESDVFYYVIETNLGSTYSTVFNILEITNCDPGLENIPDYS